MIVSETLIYSCPSHIMDELTALYADEKYQLYTQAIRDTPVLTSHRILAQTLKISTNIQHLQYLAASTQGVPRLFGDHYGLCPNGLKAPETTDVSPPYDLICLCEMALILKVHIMESIELLLFDIDNNVKNVHPSRILATRLNNFKNSYFSWNILKFTSYALMVLWFFQFLFCDEGRMHLPRMIGWGIANQPIRSWGSIARGFKNKSGGWWGRPL